MLTNNLLCDILVLSTRERIFYCQNGQLAGRGLNRFLVDTQRLSFYLEVGMFDIKEYMKEYNRSPEQRIRQKKWQQSAKGKATIKRINKKWWSSPKGKQYTRDHAIKYRQTPRGMIMNIYANQLQASKRREFPLPQYTNEELYEWMTNQKKFWDLYNAWEKQDFIKHLAPTVDRIDNEKSYFFKNMQLMTRRENYKKAGTERENDKFMARAKIILWQHGEKSEDKYDLLDILKRLSETQKRVDKGELK